MRRLKEQPGGDVLVYGSADLDDELLPADLIDEYRLLVYPLILGSGKHLFETGSTPITCASSGRGPSE